MDRPFASAKLKLSRANKHIADLDAAISSYLATSPAIFDSKIEIIDGAWRATMKVDFKGPPPELAPIVGDVFHNLRSALDLAACECVRLNNGDDKNVYFPFCEKAEDFDSFIARRNIDRACPEVVDLIRSLEPYKGGNEALRAIHDMNIRDKHIALIPNALTIGGPILQTQRDDGTPCLEFVTDPSAPSELRVVFPTDCVLANQEIIPTLHFMVKLVDRILDDFIAIHQPAKSVAEDNPAHS